MGWFVVGSTTNVLNNDVSVYNYKNTIQKVTSFKASSAALAIHPTQPYALSTCRKGIQLWTWGQFGSEWKCMQVFKDQSYVPTMAFNPEEHDSFASGSNDGTIKVLLSLFFL
jgi:WD40 repeat protein